MLVTEFAKKYGFKGKDIKIANKVYGDMDLSEDLWFAKLKSEYAFDHGAYLKNKKIKDAKEKKAITKKATATKNEQ